MCHTSWPNYCCCCCYFTQANNLAEEGHDLPTHGHVFPLLFPSFLCTWEEGGKVITAVWNTYEGKRMERVIDSKLAGDVGELLADQRHLSLVCLPQSNGKRESNHTFFRFHGLPDDT